MKIVCFILTILSAVLFPLALPGDAFSLGNPFLGFICLAPLFIAIILSPTLIFSSFLGVLFGGLSTFLLHYWLLYYGDYSIWTIGGVMLGYMIYHGILAPILSTLVRIDRAYRPFVLAAGWAVYEYIKSTGFLGFPWGLIPHSVNTIPVMVQFIDVTGVWGLSFLMAVINALAAEIILLYFPFRAHPNRLVLNQSIIAALIIFLALSYGVYRWFMPIPYQTKFKVLLVQHNDDPWSTDRGDEAIITAQKITQDALLENSPNGRPDLIVWSETAVKYYLYEETLSKIIRRYPPSKPLHKFIEETGIPFLIGAPFKPVESDGFQNAALFLSSSGELLDYYGKQHLVPVAETIPFYDFPAIKKFFGGVLGLSSGWTPGEEESIFHLLLDSGKTVEFSTPICFEDAFPNLCRRFIKKGADLWINLTNVSWSRKESAEIQMFVAARFRSIENRRVMIRSTNAGLTSVIGPKGEILGSLDLFVPAALFIEVPVYRSTSLTLYTRWGDYFPVFLNILLCFLLLWKVYKRLVSGAN
jgi:apolipoprotein N-acyltransferase